MLEHASSTSEYVGIPAESGLNSDHVETLERRLDRGWEMISKAESRGEPSGRLFDHFLRLLSEYESILDQRRTV